MGDQLFSFGEDSASATHPLPVIMMSEVQRATIRELFAQLGVGDAKSQFTIVGELTGTEIRSVNDMTATTAARLIDRLQSRIASAGQARTGNAWDDREEDTWIDRL